jgi:hypothetical protein
MDPLIAIVSSTLVANNRTGRVQDAYRKCLAFGQSSAPPPLQALRLRDYEIASRLSKLAEGE